MIRTLQGLKNLTKFQNQVYVWLPQIFFSIKAAYSFYNVATSESWVDLMSDALVLAKKLDFDVFNALDLMENVEFLEKLKFGIGDGNLQYYIYNWRSPQMTSKEVGLVLQWNKCPATQSSLIICYHFYHLCKQFEWFYKHKIHRGVTWRGEGGSYFCQLLGFVFKRFSRNEKNWKFEELLLN